MRLRFLNKSEQYWFKVIELYEMIIRAVFYPGSIRILIIGIKQPIYLTPMLVFKCVINNPVTIKSLCFYDIFCK